MKDYPFGWFTEDNASTCRDLIRAYVPKGGAILEIGSFMGRSICMMADLIQELEASVYLVDNFVGVDSNECATNKQELKNALCENVTSFGINSIIISATSMDAAKILEGLLFDYIFIDASHKECDVTNDILTWSKHLTNGGVIAGHDISIPDVFSAVNNTFAGSFCTENDIWWRCK